jgi:hypothetical protein
MTALYPLYLSVERSRNRVNGLLIGVEVSEVISHPAHTVRRDLSDGHAWLRPSDVGILFSRNHLRSKAISENKYPVLSGQVWPESSQPTDRPAAKSALTGIFFARNCLRRLLVKKRSAGRAESKPVGRLRPSTSLRG